MSTWFKENSQILSLRRADKKELGFLEVKNGLSQKSKQKLKVKKVRSPKIQNLIVRSKSLEEEKFQIDGQIAVVQVQPIQHYITAPPKRITHKSVESKLLIAESPYIHGVKRRFRL